MDRSALRDNVNGCLERLHVEHGGSITTMSEAVGVPVTTLGTWCRRHRLNRDTAYASRFERALPPAATFPPLRAVAPVPTLYQPPPVVKEPYREPPPLRSQEPWGLGGPATLDLPPKAGDYTIVGIADLHGEWREQALFDAQLRLIRELQPDLVVLLGDNWNFDIISRWQQKKLERMALGEVFDAIRTEIDDTCTNILAPVRAAANGAPVIMVEGNHDDRLRKILSDDLHAGWEKAREWLRVDDYLDGYYTRAGVYVRPEFLMRHGEKTSQNPAKAELLATDCSGWSGHLHRRWQHSEPYHPLTGRRLIHTIAPCSVRRDANYGAGNAGLMRWDQGVLVGTFSSSDPHDHVTDIGHWNGTSLLVRGMRF